MYIFALVVIIVIMVILISTREPLINSTRTVTLHYTQWCPHCHTMRPVWDNVKKSIGDSIKFIELDEDIAKTSGLEGYPTIRMVTEHGHNVEYKGTPDFHSLRNWIISPLIR